MLRKATTFLREKTVREKVYESFFYVWLEQREVLKDFAKHSTLEDLKQEMEQLRGKSGVRNERKYSKIEEYLSIVEKKDLGKPITKKERKKKRKFEENRGMGAYYGKKLPGAYSRELRNLLKAGYIEEHSTKKGFYRSTLKALDDYIVELVTHREKSQEGDKRLALNFSEQLKVLLESFDGYLRKRIRPPSRHGKDVFDLLFEMNKAGTLFFKKYPYPEFSEFLNKRHDLTETSVKRVIILLTRKGIANGLRHDDTIFLARFMLQIAYMEGEENFKAQLSFFYKKRYVGVLKRVSEIVPILPKVNL